MEGPGRRLSSVAATYPPSVGSDRDNGLDDLADRAQEGHETTGGTAGEGTDRFLVQLAAVRTLDRHVAFWYLLGVYRTGARRLRNFHRTRNREPWRNPIEGLRGCAVEGIHRGGTRTSSCGWLRDNRRRPSPPQHYFVNSQIPGDGTRWARGTESYPTGRSAEPNRLTVHPTVVLAFFSGLPR